MKPVTLKWILMQFCLASYWDSCSANKRVALIKALNSTFVAHRWEILLQIFSSVIPEVLSVAERLHYICCKAPVERYVQALRLGEGDSFTFLAWLASVHTLHEQRAICATAPGNEALELNRGIEHESVPLAPARPWIAKPPRDSVLQTSLAAYQRVKIFTHFCCLFCSYLHHSCRSLNCPVFLAFLCYWHKWWQTPGKYHKVNDQVNDQCDGPLHHRNQTCDILCDQLFGGVGYACFGPVWRTDGLPAALQSFPTVTIWVCFCCLQIFFLHSWWHFNNFKVSRELLLCSRPGFYDRMWEYGSKMSFKGCKKGIFPTGGDVVAPFFCNVSKSVMHYIVACVGNVKDQISRNDADALSNHLFLIKLHQV